MEPVISFQRSEQPATGPDSEQDESSPQIQYPFLSDLFLYHPPINA